MNQWSSEPTDEWFNEPLSHWSGVESMKQWTSESMNHSTNEPLNHWTNDSANQWMYVCMNHWMNEWMKGGRKEGRKERMNKWTSWWMDGWMDGWMHGWIDGWMNGWASYFSLLSYVFSQQPLRWLLSAISLLWAATYIWSFVASATQFFASRSQHGAFCKSSCNPAKHKSSKIGEKLPFAQLWNAFIQLQSRLPGASQHHSSFAGAAVPMRFVTTADCKPAKQERRTEIDQRSRSAGTGNSTIRRSPNMPCSYDFMWKPNSIQCAVHFLSAAFADRGPDTRKQRPYFGDPGSHIRKNTWFRAQECFHTWIQAFPSRYTFQLSWWWVVDMMMVDLMAGMLTKTIVRRSQVF